MPMTTARVVGPEGRDWERRIVGKRESRKIGI